MATGLKNQEDDVHDAVSNIFCRISTTDHAPDKKTIRLHLSILFFTFNGRQVATLPIRDESLNHIPVAMHFLFCQS